MARLQIGGGNTRVGEVYLDMLFRQRALDNARSEAAQRASIESARLQAGERNAEREAQMQMLQMEQQARMAQEARAATQAENQAQRQFSAEQQAASLGWDKEKLDKQIAKETEADKRRYEQQKTLVEYQDELRDKDEENKARLAIVGQLSDIGVDVNKEIPGWKGKSPSELLSATAEMKKKYNDVKLFEPNVAMGVPVEGMTADQINRAMANKANLKRQRDEDEQEFIKKAGIQLGYPEATSREELGIRMSEKRKQDEAERKRREKIDLMKLDSDAQENAARTYGKVLQETQDPAQARAASDAIIQQYNVNRKSMFPDDVSTGSDTAPAVRSAQLATLRQQAVPQRLVGVPSEVANRDVGAVAGTYSRIFKENYSRNPLEYIGLGRGSDVARTAAERGTLQALKEAGYSDIEALDELERQRVQVSPAPWFADKATKLY